MTQQQKWRAWRAFFCCPRYLKIASQAILSGSILTITRVSRSRWAAG
jgi:hypothetical protein